MKPEKAAKLSKSYKTIQLAYVELGHGAANKTTKKKKKPLAKKTSATKAEKTTTPAASAGDGAPAAAKTSRAETGARSKKKGKK